MRCIANLRQCVDEPFEVRRQPRPRQQGRTASPLARRTPHSQAR
jgi:hypothetical protein